jgi:hypothetical protein
MEGQKLEENIYCSDGTQLSYTLLSNEELVFFLTKGKVSDPLF